MKVSRTTFFDLYRSKFGKLTQKQVDAINVFLDNILSYPLSLRETAYLFATAYHETATTFLPLEEYGKGRGKPYGKAVDGKKYYGRGYVQLTWDYNYAKATKELLLQDKYSISMFESETGQTFDLVDCPAQAMHPKIACAILVLGSQQGWFTGKKLSDYINANRSDFINARKVINGNDKAKEIANHAQKFKEILSQSIEKESDPIPSPVEQTQETPKAPSVSLFTKIGTAITGVAGLGINLGTIIETKVNQLTPAQVGYLCLSLAVVGLAIWWYRQSANNAHRERMKGDGA